MNKGKIIDIKSDYAIVLNHQMAYEKINKKEGMTLGQDVYYFSEDLYKEKSKSYTKYALVAALFMMVLFIQPLMNQQEVFGYISVDINPSIQLEVNKDLEVLDIESKNVEGDLILQSEWIGQPADVVVDAIIKATQADGILNENRDFVLVSYYFENEDVKVEKQWTEKLDALFEKEDQDFEVAVVKANKEDLDNTSDETIGRQSVKVLIKEEVTDLMAAKEAIEQEEKVKVYRKKAPKDNNSQASEKALDNNPGKKNEKNPVFGDTDKKLGFDKEKDEIEEGYLNGQEISGIIQEDYEGNILKITFDEDDEVYIVTLNDQGTHKEITLDAESGEIEAVEILDKGRGHNKDSDDKEVDEDNEDDDEESIENDEDNEDEDSEYQENNGQNNGKNKNKPDDDKDDIDTEEQDDENNEDDDKDTEENDSEALEDEESEGDESPLLTKEQIEEIITKEYTGEIESIEAINGPYFRVILKNSDETLEIVLHGVTGKIKEVNDKKSDDKGLQGESEEKDQLEDSDDEEAEEDSDDADDEESDEPEGDTIDNEKDENLDQLEDEEDSNNEE